MNKSTQQKQSFLIAYIYVTIFIPSTKVNKPTGTAPIYFKIKTFAQHCRQLTNVKTFEYFFLHQRRNTQSNRLLKISPIFTPRRVRETVRYSVYIGEPLYGAAAVDSHRPTPEGVCVSANLYQIRWTGLNSSKRVVSEREKVSKAAIVIYLVWRVGNYAFH